MDTYEKKYKGALARCKWLLSNGMISKIAATDMFRELMDNDENIRKEIINIFHSLAEGKIPVDINYADIFTWLEKQGEQKPTIEMKSAEESLGIDSETYNKIVDECIYGERKPACSDDKKLTDVNHEYYSELLENNNSKDINDYAYQVAYCMSHDWIEETATWDDVQKACKLGAEWKEKHCNNSSTAWSEEDENTIKVLMNIIKKSEIIDSIIYTDSLKEKLYDWLKSLRPQPKQEWSEEDEKMLNRIIEDFSDGKTSNILEVYWLKSIEQRLRG